MAYIICSKKDSLATDADWQSLHNYFELGWEVSTVHLDAKHLLATGQINPQNDVIVTLQGREFLYSKLMPVMTWEEFAQKHSVNNAKLAINLPNVRDLTFDYANTAAVDPNIYWAGPEKRYCYEDSDRDLILTLDVPNVADLAAQPYCLICWRYRSGHSTGRNTSHETGKQVTEWLAQKYQRVYVVGHGTETFCNGSSIQHVTLPQFAGLCLHPNCAAVIGSMTGTLQLAAIICPTIIVAYQHNPKVPEANEVNIPCVLGECVNIRRNVRHLFYEPQVPVPEFLAKLAVILP